MAWEYKRQEQEYPQVPEGDHRVRVYKAEKAMSKAGNDMLRIELQVSGMNLHLFHYITFLDAKPEITNRMLTQFFDSFNGINDGDFDMTKWVGKVGACHVKHDDEGRARISYFIRGNRQDNLPPWKEPAGSGSDSAPERKTDAQGFMEVQEDDYLPFD